MKPIFPRQSVLSPLMAVAANIIIIFIVYSLARVEFLLENWSYFSQSVAEGRLWQLLKAGVVFDTPEYSIPTPSTCSSCSSRSI